MSSTCHALRKHIACRRQVSILQLKLVLLHILVSKGANEVCQEGLCLGGLHRQHHNATQLASSIASCTQTLFFICWRLPISMPACFSAHGQHKYSSATARLAGYCNSDSNYFLYFLKSADTCSVCSWWRGQTVPQ